MLDGIEEKAKMLLDDILDECGNASPLYVYMYDMYVDIQQYARIQNKKNIVYVDSNAEEELRKEIEHKDRTIMMLERRYRRSFDPAEWTMRVPNRDEFAKYHDFNYWGSMQEQAYQDFVGARMSAIAKEICEKEQSKHKEKECKE